MPALTSIALGVGAAATAAGTTNSFIQASKQKKKQAEAEAAASQAMQEARKRLEVNFYKNLGIKKEPYELAREASLSSASGLIQAGVESERGAGAVAGRVQMANNENQRNIAAGMGQEMQNLDKLVAGEDSRLRDVNTQLDLGVVEGAQLAARNSEMLKNQNLQQGFAGVTSLANTALSAAPLYQKTSLPTTPQTSPNTTEAGQTFDTTPFPTTQVSDPLANETLYYQNASAGTLPPQYMVNGTPIPYAQALNMGKSPDFYKTLFPQTFGSLQQ